MWCVWGSRANAEGELKAALERSGAEVEEQKAYYMQKLEAVRAENDKTEMEAEVAGKESLVKEAKTQCERELSLSDTIQVDIQSLRPIEVSVPVSVPCNFNSPWRLGFKFIIVFAIVFVFKFTNVSDKKSCLNKCDLQSPCGLLEHIESC